MFNLYLENNNISIGSSTKHLIPERIIIKLLKIHMNLRQRQIKLYRNPKHVFIT